MSNQKMDINDDEIRIISPSGGGRRNDTERKRRIILFSVIAAIAVVIIALVCLLFMQTESGYDAVPLTPRENSDKAVRDSAVIEKAYVTVRDTVADGVGLRILTPTGATPSLVIGAEALNDSSAVIVVQAADVRADNGEIAGAFVLGGELISRGQAKAGYCAIINGEITIGVADATPMLEQAIENEGYFFRQYPLVVGGQVVENKPKGRALRKALAEIDGRICVVLSKERLTFHDFSQALIDAGARNAIYLVGSYASGIYVDESGDRFKFGKENSAPYDYQNYLIWK